MINIEGEQKVPVLWPGGSLAGFGTNPYGKPVWRVVWAESINRCVGARWADGWVGYRWVQTYPRMQCYILEKWLSAWDFTKCSPERWIREDRDTDTGLMRSGPGYPSEGAYMGPAWDFDGYPTLAAVEAVIEIQVRSGLLTDWERQVLEIQSRERDRVMQVRKASEIILDSLPLSVTSGKLTNRFYKEAEKIPQRLSAQDLQKLKGLPIGDGKAFTSGARRA